MSNPYIRAWQEQNGDNPYIRAWEEEQRGTGRSLLRQATGIEELSAAGKAVFGGVGAGLVKPVEGILGFPGAVGRAVGVLGPEEQIATDRIAGVIRDFREGKQAYWEKDARRLGFSDNEISGARMLGEFAGFITPGVALYKGVGRALGTVGEGITQVPFMAGLKTDVISGLVWGGVLMEGEAPERFKNALIDGGLSGAIGLALTGVWPAFMGFRNHRLLQKLEAEVQGERRLELLRQFYDEKRAGRIPKGEEKTIFDLMSEESFILNSPAAQRILERSADEEAIVSAILDVAGARANSGLVRGVRGSYIELEEVAGRFRDQFPGMKFQVLSRETGELVERTKVVSAKYPPVPEGHVRLYRGQVKDPGRAFTGEEVAGRSFTDYLPQAEAYAEKQARSTGKEASIFYVDVPIEEAARYTGTATFGKAYGLPRRIAETKKLYEKVNITRTEKIPTKEFDLHFGTKGLSNKQRAQYKRDGYYEGQALRHVDGQEYSFVRREGDKLVVKTGKGKETRVLEKNVTDLPYGILPEERVPAQTALYRDFSSWYEGKAREVLRHREGLSDAEIRKAARDGGLLPEALGRRRIKEPNAIVGREEIDPLQQLEAQIADRLESAARAGKEEAFLLDPWDNMTFEDAVRGWAADRSLPTDGAEFLSLQRAFASSMADDLTRAARSEFPEEMARLEALRKEWEGLLGREGMPLDAQAAVKGFHLDQFEGAYRLRDINTGATFYLQDERAVQDALKRVARGERDVGEFGLPPYLVEQVMSPSAVPNRPMEEIIGDMLPDKAMHISMLKDIPTRIFTNTRDFLLRVQERTGLQIWDQGYLPVHEGARAAAREYGTWGRDIDRLWQKNGIKTRKDAVKIAEWWRAVEGKDLKPTEKIKIGREMGLEARHFAAAKEARRVWDAGFQEYGLPKEDYIGDYFGRILPYAHEHGVFPPDAVAQLFTEGIPEHLKHFAEFQRTGNLSSIEMDPRLVMQKWFKAAAMKRHVDEAYHRLHTLINTKFGDLPPAHRERLKAEAARVVKDHEPVVPEPIRKVTEEYLNTIRGAPVSSIAATQRLFSRFYNYLGVQVDERVSTEFFNTLLSTMYGSAMGARPQLLSRNHLQTTWNQYIRLGPKHFGRSMEDAITPEGFRHAYNAGAIPGEKSGIPLHDHIFEEMIESGAAGEGLFGRAVAATMNASLRAGQLSRKVAEKALLPYSTGDMLSRSWAFHYQRRHTAELLDQFVERKISANKLMQDGLPFFDKTVKEEFMKRYNTMGRESALDYIGVMAADEAHFVYGLGHQPTWMQNPFGKFAGMFGTWPLWQKEVYARVMRNGTPLQKMQAATRTATIGAALGLTGYTIGANLWNWAAPAFFTWTGGPGLNHALDLRAVIDAPMDRKAAALQRMAGNIPRLAFPGQILINDIQKATEATDDPALMAFYLMIGRPSDKQQYDFIFEREPRAPTSPRGNEMVPFEAPAPMGGGGSGVPAAGGIDLQALGLDPVIQQRLGGEVSLPVSRYQDILDQLGGNVR